MKLIAIALIVIVLLMAAPGPAPAPGIRIEGTQVEPGLDHSLNGTTNTRPAPPVPWASWELLRLWIGAVR